MLIAVLDYVSWEIDEELEEEVGEGVLRIHNLIWEVGDKLHEQLSALIHTSGPFHSIYLCVLVLILLFHLLLLRNQYALRLQWCSDIYPSWGVRVRYSVFLLSIHVWYPYHYPLPHFHISYLHFLNGENCPLLDSIISCRSNKEVPWWSPLWHNADHCISLIRSRIKDILYHCVYP